MSCDKPSKELKVSRDLTLIIAMYNSFSLSVYLALAITEMKMRDGSAHATSEHPAPWTADKAFILGHANAWHAGSMVDGFPAMVWYEFPGDKTFVPARVSFRPRQDCCVDEAPTVWQFIGKGGIEMPIFNIVFCNGVMYICISKIAFEQYLGSNDEKCGKYGSWTVLCEDQSNSGYTSKYWTKYCDVDEKIYKKFRCLGISVLNTKNAGRSLSLKDVRMWKKKYE